MTDRRVLNRAARACVALEACGNMSPVDRAAKDLAYTLCRVVMLGMNGLDQTGPGSARTVRCPLEMSAADVRRRLRREFKAVIDALP